MIKPKFLRTIRKRSNNGKQINSISYIQSWYGFPSLVPSFWLVVKIFHFRYFFLEQSKISAQWGLNLGRQSEWIFSASIIWIVVLIVMDVSRLLFLISIIFFPFSCDNSLWLVGGWFLYMPSKFPPILCLGHHH